MHLSDFIKEVSLLLTTVNAKTHTWSRQRIHVNGVFSHKWNHHRRGGIGKTVQSREVGEGQRKTMFSGHNRTATLRSSQQSKLPIQDAYKIKAGYIVA